MGRAIAVRTDYTSGKLRRLAQRTKNAAQTCRLLAIAAVLDGASRAAAAHIGGMDRQTWWRAAMGWNLRAALISAASVICGAYSYSFPAFAEEVTPRHVPAKLTCGSHSSNPAQNRAFQVDLQFDVTGSLWLLDWKTERAEVKFRGILSPSGTMLIAGLGKSDEGPTWTYEFSGHKNTTGIAVLKGSLQSEQPKGTRSCSLTLRN